MNRKRKIEAPPVAPWFNGRRCGKFSFEVHFETLQSTNKVTNVTSVVEEDIVWIPRSKYIGGGSVVDCRVIGVGPLSSEVGYGPIAFNNLNTFSLSLKAGQMVGFLAYEADVSPQQFVKGAAMVYDCCCKIEADNNTSTTSNVISGYFESASVSYYSIEFFRKAKQYATMEKDTKSCSTQLPVHFVLGPDCLDVSTVRSYNLHTLFPSWISTKPNLILSDWVVKDNVIMNGTGYFGDIGKYVLPVSEAVSLTEPPVISLPPGFSAVSFYLYLSNGEVTISCNVTEKVPWQEREASSRRIWFGMLVYSDEFSSDAGMWSKLQFNPIVICESPSQIRVCCAKGLIGNVVHVVGDGYALIPSGMQDANMSGLMVRNSMSEKDWIDMAEKFNDPENNECRRIV